MNNQLSGRSILQLYLKDGYVDYQRLMQDDWFKEKITWLENTDIPDYRRFEEFAFWLDAYNLLTLKAVCNKLRKDPNWKGNLSLWSKIRFFYLMRHKVGKKKLSLYTIENKILRKRFKDPRIHFAINCASISCPILPDQLFSNVILDEYLEHLTSKFINNNTSVILVGNQLKINPIFKWYKKDFNEDGGVLTFIQKYWQGKEIPNDITIDYLEYNWQINAQ